MIARITVEYGDLTEYPLAECVRGGWQNGVRFYPDEQVTDVQELQCFTADSLHAHDTEVRADERERCARIAETEHSYRGSVEQWAAREIAARIRRGEGE